MWSAVAVAVIEIVKFLCKWGMDVVDTNAERRKDRRKIKEEIKNAKTARKILLGISRYNRV